MIDGLKPYPAMKASGVPWLGGVPRHWAVRRLKRVCSRSALYGANVVATSYTTIGARFLRTTDITDDGQLKGAGVFLPEESMRDYLLSDGDLLLSRSGTIGRSFLYDSTLHGPCAYAGYLVRFVPASDVLPRYLFLYTKTSAFTDFLRAVAISSTIENVNGDKYASMVLPVPPLPEQAAIVRFLDHADRRIRRYIRAKQKLIKLLEEQKQAIVHRAVTRGLDPNVPLKPSGVEWLGDVPEHWDIVPNRAILRLEKRPVGHASGNYLLLSLTKRGVIARDMDNPEGKFPASFDTYQEVNPGDLVFCLFDIDETPRAVGLSTLHGMITGAYTCFACHPSVAAWVHLFYLAMDNGKHLRPLYTGLRKVITKSSFLSAKMPLPPTADRVTILACVETSICAAAEASSRAQREVDLLREYRTRLIADVVTGKLDVREAVAMLPDETDEPELLDAVDAPTAAEEDAAEDVDAVPEEIEA